MPAIQGSPRAYQCLLFVAEHPGTSNREIANAIGVSHKSQISRLLSQLLKEGLAVKRSQGAGKRNEWRLTTFGEELARTLSKNGFLLVNS